MNKPLVNFLELSQCPILEQLRLEEALLRLDSKNWCLLNKGSPPAIVLGISGKPDLMIDKDFYRKKAVLMVQRFSGGGTVFIDEDTLFLTFIFNEEEIEVPAYPDKVFHWSEKIYRAVFDHIPFALRENDYVIGNRKFGGNAQYMRHRRWLHHTSLLWDFKEDSMNYLLLPSKRPKYRLDRSHEEFLCRLKNFFMSPESLIAKLKSVLEDQFELCSRPLAEVLPLLEQPHRQATAIVHFAEEEKKTAEGREKSVLSTLYT